MIRKYRTGDAFRLQVQPEQRAEAVLGAAEFEHIRAFSLVESEYRGMPNFAKTETAPRQNNAIGDRVLAVFGFRTGDDDIAAGREAECFALVGTDAGRKLIEAVRFFRRYIPRQASRLRVRRVTMTVRVGFAAGERFARMLGFSSAGTAENFFNGVDYQIFERVEK